MEGYMHLAEAARQLGVTRRTLLARIARGEMQAERIHEKLWLVSRDEVERWKVIGKMKPGPKPTGQTASTKEEGER